MGSLYLSRLSKDARTKLEQQLWEQQGRKCFISGLPIDLDLDEIDVDHIIPTRDSGKDDASNFALTLAHYNRSKQAADLRVARVLARFDKIKEAADSEDRGPNLNDVLRDYGGANSELRMKIEGAAVTFVNGAVPITVPLFEDKLSGFKYFFALLARLPFWIDRQASSTIFGAKQTYSFWQSILENGTSTAGHKVLPSGLNIAEMIKT
jgi:HNH endonuclease